MLHRRNTFVMIQEAITPKLKGLHLLSLGLGIATTGAVFVTLPMTQAASNKEAPPMPLAMETSSPVAELSMPKPPEVIEYVFGPETITIEKEEPIELATSQAAIELTPTEISLTPSIGSLKIDATLPPEFDQL